MHYRVTCKLGFKEDCYKKLGLFLHPKIAIFLEMVELGERGGVKGGGGIITTTGTTHQ